MNLCSSVVPKNFAAWREFPDSLRRCNGTSLKKKTAFAARERFLYFYALNVFDFSESFEAGVPVGGAEAIALTERIFSGDSPWLKTCLRMESRPQQTNMALAAARAFSASAALLFEAGTEIGRAHV